MTASSPCLILLDCQTGHVTGSDGRIDPENQQVIKRIGQLLQHARGSGWTVCHCQLADDKPAAARVPVNALRPNAREAVFVRRGLSAFSDSYFHQVLARNTGPRLVVGFSAPFSVLATAFDAQTRGEELTLVPDAIGALAVEPRNVADTRAMAFDLASRLGPVMSWDAVEAEWLAEDVHA